MFGEKLKARREEKGLSQDDVADFFGENFSRQAVSKWERDGGYPEVEMLSSCAKDARSVSMTSPSPESELMCSFSKRTSIPSSFR